MLRNALPTNPNQGGPHSLTLDLPLPPKACSPNFKGHWGEKGRATKQYREAARLICYASKPKGWNAERVRIHAEFFLSRHDTRGYHPLDKQNAIASIKAAIDGLVDAKLIPNDSNHKIVWEDPILHRSQKEHKGKAAVLLHIEVLDAD